MLVAVLILIALPMQMGIVRLGTVLASFSYVNTEPYIFIQNGTGAEVLLDSGENFYIIHVKDGDIYFRKYDSSHSLSVPDVVLYDSGVNKRMDAVFDDFGFIHMTWSTDFYGDWSTMYMKIDPSGTVVVPAINLSGNNTAWDIASAIDVNSLGDAYVAWDHWWNPNSPWAEDVLYAKINSDGSVAFTQQYLAPVDWSTAFYGKKDLVVDRSDNLHIIFDLQDGNDIRVYFKKYASDGTTVLIGEKQLISYVYKGWASAMEAVLDSRDKINIGQTYGVPGGKMETFYVRIDLEGNLEVGPVPLSPQDNYHSHQAFLAIDDSDNSYVFWRETQGGNGEVYYAVVDQNGTVVLNSTRLTHSPESEQSYYMGGVFDSLARCFWSYYNDNGTYVIYPVAPVADAGGPYVAHEGDTITLSAAGSYDENGDALQYRWDLDMDGIWDTNWSREKNLSFVWGDDVNLTVTVEVTDGSFYDIDVAVTAILNVAPTLEEINWSAQAGGEPRTIGYWKHQCGENLRSPDHVGIQQSFIDHISNSSQVFAGISTKSEVCDQLDDKNHRNMTQKAMQQLMALWLNVASGKLDLNSKAFVNELNKSMSLSEVIDWIEQTILNNTSEDMETAKDMADETNNANLFAQGGVATEAIVSDPGSDDLIFTWDWGDGTRTEHICYNDGLGPDPYPSPDVNPMMTMDTATHSYASTGAFTITLTVTDDDGGLVGISLLISI
ncbi:MAG: PKD domain-containing protein [Thermoplasmata archaeon]